MKSNTRQKKPRRPDTCRHDRMLNVGYVCVDCVGAALKAYDNWAKQPDPSSCESNTLDDGAATDRLVRAMERLKKDSKGAR